VAGGKYFQLTCGRAVLRHQIELELEAFGFANPVALHGPDFFRPALEPVERLQQLLRHIGDFEKPLGELALLDLGARAPALAVDHLLIGKHGVVDRVPVHLGAAARDDSLVEKIQKQLLLLGVIFRVAGGKFAAPVDRQTQRFELGPHGVNIGVGPFGRVDAARHGGILGRHAKRVPAHGVKHVEALGAFVAGDDIAHGVIAHMPHMNPPRRVGEHLKHIIFGLAGILIGEEQVFVVPQFLPVGFAFPRVVTRLRHIVLIR